MESYLTYTSREIDFTNTEKKDIRAKQNDVE